MSLNHDISDDFQSTTLAYIDRLNNQSLRVMKMIETVPMPKPLRHEFLQTWRITRQKLAYFRHELSRAEGELQDDLEVLHGALLPEVIGYQVRLGAMMINDCTDDHRYIHQWKAIWSNFKLD